MNRPMQLRDRKLKTCKLACMQTMGSGGSEGTESITFHQYHQRTELILLSHVMASLLCVLLKFSS